MENNNQNTPVSESKRPFVLVLSTSKHLVISLSIIGVTVVVALVFAVIAIIGNSQNRINKKNPEQLYDSLVSSVESSGNYPVNIHKWGSGTLFSDSAANDKAIDEVIETDEVGMVDGNNVYYKKTLKRVSDGKETTTTLEITVVGGVKYYRYIAPGKPAQKYRSLVTNDDYKEATELLSALIWEYGDLFDDVKLEDVPGGKKANMNMDEVKDDPAFNAALTRNAQEFFADNAGTNGAMLAQLPIQYFDDYNYSVIYNSDGRATAVEYSYAMGNGNYFAGDVSLTAGLSYGSAVITAPADADDYDWANK